MDNSGCDACAGCQCVGTEPKFIVVTSNESGLITNKRVRVLVVSFAASADPASLRVTGVPMGSGRRRRPIMTASLGDLAGNRRARKGSVQRAGGVHRVGAPNSQVFEKPDKAVSSRERPPNVQR
jgi:hypothetical protein